MTGIHSLNGLNFLLVVPVGFEVGNRSLRSITPFNLLVLFVVVFMRLPHIEFIFLFLFLPPIEFLLPFYLQQPTDATRNAVN